MDELTATPFTWNLGVSSRLAKASVSHFGYRCHVRGQLNYIVIILFRPFLLLSLRSDLWQIAKKSLSLAALAVAADGRTEPFVHPALGQRRASLRL